MILFMKDIFYFSTKHVIQSGWQQLEAKKERTVIADKTGTLIDSEKFVDQKKDKNRKISELFP